jgi:basic membrane protein A
MDCGSADKFVTQMGTAAYYGGLKEGFVDVSPLSANCAPNTQAAIDAVRKMIVDGEWDVFSGVKLTITADGTVTKADAPLVDNAGTTIVAAGGNSVDDSVITGLMDYFVAGVEKV